MKVHISKQILGLRRRAYLMVPCQLINQQPPIPNIIINSEVASLVDVPQQPTCLFQSRNSVVFWKEKRTWEWDLVLSLKILKMYLLNSVLF